MKDDKVMNSKIGRKLSVWLLALFLVASASAAVILDSVINNGPQGTEIEGGANVTVSQAVWTREIRFIGSMDGDDSSTYTIAEDGLSFIISLQANNGDYYDYWIILWNDATKDNDVLVECPLDEDFKTKDNIKLEIDTIHTGVRLSYQRWSFTVADNNAAIIGLRITVGNDVIPGFYDIPITITIMEVTSHIENSHRPNGDPGDYDGDGLPNWQELDYDQNTVTGDGVQTDPFDDDQDDDGLKDSTEDANSNGQVDPGETDPLDPDMDNDGLSDGLELGLTEPEGTGTADTWQPDEDPDSTTDPFDADSDNDNLTDDQEDKNKNGKVDADETDPVDTDTDDDGLCDGWIDYIIPNGLKDPLEGEDLNLDTVVDATETDPTKWDTDGDNLPDGLERGHYNQEVPGGISEGINVLYRVIYLGTDIGSSNYIEDLDHGATKTDPLDTDTDDDNLTDDFEDVNIDGIIEGDSSFWGILESDEIWTELDPNSQDSDEDRLDDWMEIYIYHTNPNSSDTDGDGLNDYNELFVYHTDPTPGGGGVDLDGDGLTDEDEIIIYKTSPSDKDTDNDGLEDGEEINIYNTDPNKSDSDLDGLEDVEEVITYNTDPNNEDSDNDGLTDYEEINTYNTNPNDVDSDNDGLNDGDEVNTYFTDPDDIDSDDDGLTDGDEVNVHNSNPNREHSDNDGLDDFEEVNSGTDGYITDPNDSDSDGDGLKDDVELAKGTNPTLPDTDNDGLNDKEEITMTTDPNDIDTDKDGLKDGEEVNTYFCNPKASDTDNDGLDDYEEAITYGTDPSLFDTDVDGLNDYDEIITHDTDPNISDTDGDGMPDGWEVDNSLNPKSDDSGEDPDFDGYTNLEEYTADTDPQDVGSHP